MFFCSAGQNAIDEVHTVEGGEVSSICAVAGRSLVSSLRAVNRTQGRLSRTFISGAARSEEVRDSDCGDDADDRDDDEEFDQRESFLAFGSHANFLLLIFEYLRST